MQRSYFIPAVAALAFALAPAPASAATADPNASCAGLAGASRAGQPGAETAAVFETFIESEHDGLVRGALFSEFARFHDATAEVCLD